MKKKMICDCHGVKWNGHGTYKLVLYILTQVIIIVFINLPTFDYNYFATVWQWLLISIIGVIKYNAIYLYTIPSETCNTITTGGDRRVGIVAHLEYNMRPGSK